MFENWILLFSRFFLTLTDLDNHYLKKSKNVNKYIYYFHGAGSTFKGYTKKAFDNYDIIYAMVNSKKMKLNLEKIKKVW